MKYFDFSADVVSRVIMEIRKATEYIKIAIFQLHSKEVFDVLNKKLQEGISVEVMTLPYDSINPKEREDVERRFKELIRNGALVSFNKWNVGDPGRTTTAVGRWYSFHGKFVVTDKSAISLSANFLQTTELDAVLIYADEGEIAEFNEKFEELKELFITPYDGSDGKIKDFIIKSGNSKAQRVFTLPKNISRDHFKNWILEYPPELCNKNLVTKDGFYITPFDCKGRDFIEKIIEQAQEFVYISDESFTDKQFPNFLKKIKAKGIDIKLLTGAESMDFSDRMQAFLKGLIAAGIKVRTTEADLHAKLIITDNHVVVSSINLNKINLGFNRPAGFWRENTETINVCSDLNIIRIAKEQFEYVFLRSKNMADKLSEKNINVVTALLMETYGKKATKEARLYLSELLVEKDVEKEKQVLVLLDEIIRIVNNEKVDKITKKHIDVAMANLSKIS